MTFIDLQGSPRTKMDLKGPSRTFEDSWVPIISRGSTIGSDMPSALGLVWTCREISGTFKIFPSHCNNQFFRCYRPSLNEFVSVAATGNGGGCVLASATAHVAESQQTPSLYYHPSPAYKQVLYRTIFPTLKGI